MIREAALGAELITVPAGTFVMGAGAADKFATDTERPAHRVTLASFGIGSVPVTVREFRAYAPDHAPGDDEALPAVNVTWHEAAGYCAWLAAQTGVPYRLPSEAEWEYACRAGTTTPFACGADVRIELANYLYTETGERVGCGGRTRVGVYPANAFGLHDHHGNVCEWVADIWHASYHGAPNDGTAWTTRSDSSFRVIRGGVWDYLP